MKKIIVILIVFLGSCTPSKAVLKTDTALFRYSKSGCLGNCPVYDLYIFENGSVLYNGIKNTSKKKAHSTITLEKIATLKSLFNAITVEEYQSVKGRDIPITTIVFNNKRVKYNANTVTGNLLKIDSLIQEIIREIQ
ncbi:hypothetical protein FNW52_19090 [Flavobacterium sp. ZT3R18]|uniref:DUF6438 domain-containing protein n=1 Tax=Flavobacterium sp. ZT3R18 TaxID=2594429 RepID=UPI00117B6FDB|nr:DUF6438 domain-containing protein [Flavobacterium sp. ZT3R18]TRX31148.1 hypothetical protein FNW52_19090 [Flavobacterium sp. ZT3R18]